jgi:hypothetical protein
MAVVALEPDAEERDSHQSEEEEEEVKGPEEEYEEEYTAEEIEWTPNAKLKRISEVDVSELPKSYRVNSDKETLCLEYVANFERQYVDLYPFRAPLLLCPLNECGIPVRAAPAAVRARVPAGEASRRAVRAAPR